MSAEFSLKIRWKSTEAKIMQNIKNIVLIVINVFCKITNILDSGGICQI